jgi:uncharacterized protein (DUF983 family)
VGSNPTFLGDIMARIYDVVCPHCGEVYQWCKYDPPIEKCDNCGAKLAHEEHGELVWDADVHIFGVWSTSEDVKVASERIRREFEAEQKK